MTIGPCFIGAEPNVGSSFKTFEEYQAKMTEDHRRRP